MLQLQLRDEFLGSQMPGTAIALRDSDKKGAVERDADFILSITYPTADVQTALRAISTARTGRPIVLNGDRGRGKSHIMAVMHHALASAEKVEGWVSEWGKRPGMEALSGLALQRGFFPISEPVHNHEYPLLWDLLFERHPKGQFYRGKFEALMAQGQYFPPKSLLVEMFTAAPTALVLDELQTWYSGLPDDTPSYKYKSWAFNFIQNLSELAVERPDILILVASVLNNASEAYQQLHRNNPVLIDFRGPTAKQDRLNLVLYRLFKNRDNIPDGEVRGLVAAYAGERFRLRYSHLSEAERDRITAEVIQSWPIAPELMELLEDQILMSETAQQARDLIKILAQVYRARGDAVPVITAGDFFVDDDACGVQSLLDSIATAGGQERLREIARRNLETVREVGAAAPHDRELISALWMRSMSPGKNAGGTRQELHLDITRLNVVDDNAFNGELAVLIENSINIHGEESADGRLHFGVEDNPRTKVRSTARNDKLWQTGASSTAGVVVHPGKDIEHIRNTVKYLLVPEAKQPIARVIILGPNWESDPWTDVEEGDQPDRWDRPVLIVMPKPLLAWDSPEGSRVQGLGQWLAIYVPKRRNTVRFLMPAAGSKGIYEDAELLFHARCAYLTTIAWKGDGRYSALRTEFEKPLQNALKTRFDRFAVLRRWDYQQPDLCTFEVEQHKAQSASEIAFAVESKLQSDLFDPDDFKAVVLGFAKAGKLVGPLLDELSEPPATPTTDAIPFLGETAICERLIGIAAKGSIALNVGGTWVVRSSSHASDDEAAGYIRQKAYRTGQELRQMQLGLPSAVGGITVAGAKPPVEPVVVITPIVTPTLQPTPSVKETQNGLTVSGGDLGTMTLPTPQPTPASVKRTEEASTGINLTGSFEKWGLSADKQIEATRLEFKDLTVSQIKQILTRIPSSFKAFLEVSFDLEDET